MSKILVGTSGWSYVDWRGPVYPAGPSSRFDALTYLSAWFDTLEINSSFYRTPTVSTVQSWVDRIAHRPKSIDAVAMDSPSLTSPDFTFSMKLARELTHDRRPGIFSQHMEAFCRSASVLHEAGRLGAVLMQFPWSFRCTDENLRWIERLAKSLAPMPTVAEVRHADWLASSSAIETLRTMGVGFCNIDQPAMRSNLPPTSLATSATAYVRLHGRNAEQWFAEHSDSAQRYNYLYRQGELAEWAQRIGELATRADRVVVYTNNHFCGQAVANALQLKSIFLNRRIAVPPQLVKAFPTLRDITDDVATQKVIDAIDAASAQASSKKMSSTSKKKSATENTSAKRSASNASRKKTASSSPKTLFDDLPDAADDSPTAM